MAGRQMAVLVLDEMQELDQQIAPALGTAEKGAHLAKSLGFALPALERGAPPAATRAGMTRLVRSSMAFRQDWSPQPPGGTLAPPRFALQSECERSGKQMPLSVEAINERAEPIATSRRSDRDRAA